VTILDFQYVRRNLGTSCMGSGRKPGDRQRPGLKLPEEQATQRLQLLRVKPATAKDCVDLGIEKADHRK
jgi:hypothetical protein